MLPEKIALFFRQYHIPPKSRLLIAYSGGPDSTALLHALRKLQPRLKLELRCAYFDHGIRSAKERKHERRIVTNNCNEVQIACSFGSEVPGSLINEKITSGESLEAIARRKRFAFFETLYTDFPYDYIVTGHTADDQLETVMMRIFQGSGPEGLKGMLPVTQRVIRPMFWSSRKEVEAYLVTHNIAYSMDSSNLETDYLRNRVRHMLIPIVREIFKGAGKSLSIFSEKMAFISEFVKKQAEQLIIWEKSSDGFKTDAVTFFNSPPVLRCESLYAVYDRFVVENKSAEGRLNKQLPYNFIRPLITDEVVDSEKRILCDGHGIRFIRNNDTLFLELSVVYPRKIDYVIPVSSGTTFDFGTISGELYDAEPEDSEPQDIFIIHEDEMAPPLMIRSWRYGDRIDLGFGHKKLKKLFQDWKIEPNVKHQIPVLVDQKGIFAVLGKAFGCINIRRFHKTETITANRKIFYLALHGRDNFNTLK